MAVLKIKNEDFQKIISESNKPVLVDFWASWCGPCKMLAPVIDEFAADHPEFVIGKVNVDEEPELTRKFRIRSVPTLIAFRNGEEVNRAVGVLDEDELLELLQA